MKPDDPSYVPENGHALIIGQIGSSAQWYYFDDTVKGRDEARKWLGDYPSLRRMFRVYFTGVVEMEVVPPVPAKLREKQ